MDKGAYVFATKYRDGDPGDQWCVGFYDREEGGRHFVVDSAGKQFRASGFRRCERVARPVGEWLVAHSAYLEQSQAGMPVALNLWGLIDSEHNRELLREEDAALTSHTDAPKET